MHGLLWLLLRRAMSCGCMVVNATVPRVRFRHWVHVGGAKEGDENDG